MEEEKKTIAKVRGKLFKVGNSYGRIQESTGMGGQLGEFFYEALLEGAYVYGYPCG